MYLLWNIVLIRLKLIQRNKAVVALNVFIVILFILVIGNLYEESGELTKFKIGYVDNSNTEISRNIISYICEYDLFSPMEVSYEEGLKMVKNSGIEIMLVISDDLDEKIFDEDYEEMGELYFLEENQLAPNLDELIGSCFLKEIAFYQVLDSIEKELIDDKDVDEIINSIKLEHDELFSNPKHNYYIDISFDNIENGETANFDSINHELLYNQLVIGIILSFIGFYILFVGVNIVKDSETKMTDKIIISKTKRITLVLGEYISIILSTLFLIITCAFLNGYYSDNFLKVFVLSFIVFLLFVCAFGAFMLFIAKIINKVSNYIVVGSAIVFIVGIVSGCFFFIDLSIPLIRDIALFTPNYHGLTQMSNIVSYKSLLDIETYIAYNVVFSAFFVLLSVPLFNKN